MLTFIIPAVFIITALLSIVFIYRISHAVYTGSKVTPHNIHLTISGAMFTLATITLIVFS